MVTHLFDAAAGVAFALAVAASSPALSQIHGTVVAVDRAHGTFRIHHDAFPAMPMAMTMDVRPKHPADLRTLHVGERIDATVDISTEPWIGTGIRPAAARGAR